MYMTLQAGHKWYMDSDLNTELFCWKSWRSVKYTFKTTGLDTLTICIGRRRVLFARVPFDDDPRRVMAVPLWALVRTRPSQITSLPCRSLYKSCIIISSLPVLYETGSDKTNRWPHAGGRMRSAKTPYGGPRTQLSTDTCLSVTFPSPLVSISDMAYT